MDARGREEADSILCGPRPRSRVSRRTAPTGCPREGCLSASLAHGVRQKPHLRNSMIGYGQSRKSVWAQKRSSKSGRQRLVLDLHERRATQDHRNMRAKTPVRASKNLPTLTASGKLASAVPLRPRRLGVLKEPAQREWRRQEQVQFQGSRWQAKTSLTRAGVCTGA